MNVCDETYNLCHKWKPICKPGQIFEEWSVIYTFITLKPGLIPGLNMQIYANYFIFLNFIIFILYLISLFLIVPRGQLCHN